MASTIISKRFPANVTLDKSTFLNNKTLDGELYAIFQEKSIAVQKKDNDEEYETIVYKKDLPSQVEMCTKLGISSPKTYRTRLGKLIEAGYIEKRENGDYYLPNMEDIYLLIPKDTIAYLCDNCKEHVIKIYVYLGQRYKYAQSKGQQYEFSLKEIALHIGLGVNNYGETYRIINNALDLLCNSGLIQYVEYSEGVVQKKKLTHFDLNYISQNKKG